MRLVQNFSTPRLRTSKDGSSNCFVRIVSSRSCVPVQNYQILQLAATKFRREGYAQHVGIGRIIDFIGYIYKSRRASGFHSEGGESHCLRL